MLMKLTLVQFNFNFQSGQKWLENTYLATLLCVTHPVVVMNDHIWISQFNPAIPEQMEVE